MNKVVVLFLCLIFTNVEPNIGVLSQNKQIYIYSKNYGSNEIFLKKYLSDAGIEINCVDTLNRYDADNLYVVFNVDTVAQSELPNNYIAYQTTAISTITNGYLEKLTNAIAVWDYSRENISKYQNKIHHYHYFPHDYEFIDPIVLPCFLPHEAWKHYQDVLIYANTKNTDISSHLPALFCHSFLRKPSIILELGVRGGESTIPLRKAAALSGATLIGVDMDPIWKKTYADIEKSLFFCMNDTEFPAIFKNDFKGKKIDVIFIDTSHLYEHTLQEISLFVPLLSENGLIAFHDSNVTPLAHSGYVRLNGSLDGAPGNTRGVTQAIKKYFDIEFDEYNYYNAFFEKDGINWHIVHYPFCNGLTVLKKIKTS